MGAGRGLRFPALLLRVMTLDILDLLRPTAVIHAQRLDLSMRRDLVEP
jgi:hypothetical protein